MAHRAGSAGHAAGKRGLATAASRLARCRDCSTTKKTKMNQNEPGDCPPGALGAVTVPQQQDKNKPKMNPATAHLERSGP
eukprot:scaffold1527_cov101-Isochrysis_galbana.AAC.1